ncbi:hypothetical protein K7X08_030359 [Anisodus acutangulus]|uniref:Uncharacterized protein n=1 Tax=Anisodus acutangulus TaxID=402998 RepID=A0A9Q1LQ45_9SOLA|nr:hypothetical protein K7X08_030359 [Anisodus acutangulus]
MRNQLKQTLKPIEKFTCTLPLIHIAVRQPHYMIVRCCFYKFQSEKRFETYKYLMILLGPWQMVPSDFRLWGRPMYSSRFRLASSSCFGDAATWSLELILLFPASVDHQLMQMLKLVLVELQGMVIS